MRKGKILLLVSWLAAIGLLVIITLYNQNKIDRFMGLTGRTEDSISFPYPVYIKEISVLEGQKVKKGDLLAIVERANIAPESHFVDYKLEALKAKQLRSETGSNAKLEELEITHESQQANLRMQLKELKLKRAKNREIASLLKSTDIQINNSRLKLKIAALEKKMYYLNEKFKTKKSALLKQMDFDKLPVAASKKGLDEKRSQLLIKEETVKIFAQEDCEIGDVNFGRQAYVKSYDEIISTHPVSPKYVTGYIYEDAENTLHVGQDVFVEPLSQLYNQKKIIRGKVLSVSARIEGFPVRLKKYKIVPLWGYKVLIEIPKSTLKLGQKVAITTEDTIDNAPSNIEKILRFLKLK